MHTHTKQNIQDKHLTYVTCSNIESLHNKDTRTQFIDIQIQIQIQIMATNGKNCNQNNSLLVSF